MNPYSDEQAARIREMDSVFRLVRRQINAEWHRIGLSTLENLEGKGLNYTHGKLVVYIVEKGPLKSSEAAELLGITNGAVTGIADKLIELGLIERKRSDSDRRIAMLYATDKSQTIISAIDQIRDQMMIKLFHDLSDDEIEFALRLFRKMSKNLDKYDT
ncbi:MarR family winged helix-turn-helix transcriptional regulator [Paenibacillus protaetiae]|nr:MarR family transcriptional regulator [Paenibacillus protaetiae]